MQSLKVYIFAERKNEKNGILNFSPVGLYKK